MSTEKWSTKLIEKWTTFSLTNTTIRFSEEYRSGGLSLENRINSYTYCSGTVFDPTYGSHGNKMCLTKPLKSAYVSSDYGQRDGRMHYGIDLATISGTPIYASFGGVVAKTGYNPGGAGNYIVINHVVNGVAMSTTYMHMAQPASVTVGSVVTSDDVIGYVGSTGYSTGAHLHFQVHNGWYNGGSLEVNALTQGIMLRDFQV